MSTPSATPGREGQSDAEIEAAALGWINEVRRQNGLMPIKKVPDRDRDEWLPRARAALKATAYDDMLAALEAVIGAFDKTDGRPDHYNWMERVALSMEQVRAAHAKATGAAP